MEETSAAPSLPFLLCIEFVVCCRTYEDMDVLEADYVSGDLHPGRRQVLFGSLRDKRPFGVGDLKPSLARQLNVILQPVRTHFETDPQAKALLTQIKVMRNRTS